MGLMQWLAKYEHILSEPQKTILRDFVTKARGHEREIGVLNALQRAAPAEKNGLDWLYEPGLKNHAKLRTDSSQELEKVMGDLPHDIADEGHREWDDWEDTLDIGRHFQNESHPEYLQKQYDTPERYHKTRFDMEPVTDRSALDAYGERRRK